MHVMEADGDRLLSILDQFDLHAVRRQRERDRCTPACAGPHIVFHFTIGCDFRLRDHLEAVRLYLVDHVTEVGHGEAM